MDIKNISTRDLVEELKTRKGVRTLEVESYAPYSVGGTGPVIVLVVED